MDAERIKYVKKKKKATNYRREICDDTLCAPDMCEVTKKRVARNAVRIGENETGTRA